MRLILLVILLRTHLVFSCSDGTYCKELTKVRHTYVKRETKCSMWVYMLAPDLFPSQITAILGNRILMQSYCPQTCNFCNQTAQTTQQKKMENIFKTNAEFKSLVNKFHVLDIFVNASDVLKRFEIYSQRKSVIDDHNQQYKSGLTSYTMTSNKFTVAKDEEIPPNSLILDFEPQELSKTQIKRLLKGRGKRSVSNASVDWRNTMKIVQNQKTCGGCWAFAMNSAVESFLNISGINIDDSLSVQQLLDCDRDMNFKYRLSNKGCGGGYFHIAIDYFKNKGITGGDDYPFQAASTGTCQLKTPAISPKIKTFDNGYVTSNTSDGLEALALAMEQRVALGPVAVGMAVSPEIYAYGNGIFDGPCGTVINHAVVIVGYTPDYWIVRNSWGQDWGENGYIRIKRVPNQDPCFLVRYWSQPTEIGIWDNIMPVGESFVLEEEEEEENDNILSCEGCEVCECEDEDDDDDEYWEYIRENTHSTEVVKTTKETSTVLASTKIKTIPTSTMQNLRSKSTTKTPRTSQTLTTKNYYAELLSKLLSKIQ